MDPPDDELDLAAAAEYGKIMAQLAMLGPFSPVYPPASSALVERPQSARLKNSPERMSALAQLGERIDRLSDGAPKSLAKAEYVRVAAFPGFGGNMFGVLQEAGATARKTTARKTTAKKAPANKAPAKKAK